MESQGNFSSTEQGEPAAPKYQIGQQVNIIVAAATPLGFRVVITAQDASNPESSPQGFSTRMHDTASGDDGMLYSNEVFEELRAGQKTVAYVKKIREDGKIDLILQPLGSFGMDAVGEKIMKLLAAKGGFLPVDDKTAPDDIYDLFGVSKKKFKMALGGLYKKRCIEIVNGGIQLPRPKAADHANKAKGANSRSEAKTKFQLKRMKMATEFRPPEKFKPLAAARSAEKTKPLSASKPLQKDSISKK